MSKNSQKIQGAVFIVILCVITVSCGLFDNTDSHSPTGPGVSPEFPMNLVVSEGLADIVQFGVAICGQRFCVNLPSAGVPSPPPGVYRVTYTTALGGTFCIVLEVIEDAFIRVELGPGDTLDTVMLEKGTYEGTAAGEVYGSTTVYSRPGIGGPTGCENGFTPQSQHVLVQGGDPVVKELDCETCKTEEPPTCLPNGAVCTSDAECCSGYCAIALGKFFNGVAPPPRRCQLGGMDGMTQIDPPSLTLNLGS